MSGLWNQVFFPRTLTICQDCQTRKKSIGFATFVSLISCLRIWIKNFKILYTKRTSYKRHILMLIVFGSFLKLYAKKIVTMRIKKKKSHKRNALL